MTIRPANLLFSFNTFVAAMLALYIGFAADLPRPYWAMLTVYIVAQPVTGALRSKAVFRVLGTVLGAIVAVMLVPALVNAPVLLSLAMSGWAGLCLYLSLLDRTPRAYIFMLAGYTAAIIGFPSVVAPGDVFDTAVSRVEEITLGIVCATVVHTIVFPRDVGTVLQHQIARYLADASRWISDALRGRHGKAEEAERRRLASDVTELQVLATHLPFDTSNLRVRTSAIRALQDQLALLLPLLSGVEDRLVALGSAAPPLLTVLVEDTAAWAGDASPSPGEAAQLQARCEDLFTELVSGRSADWGVLLLVSAVTRLRELIAALQHSRDLGLFIADPDMATPPHLAEVVKSNMRRPLHRDHGLSALSAFALAMAVLACCCFWILTGWPEGAIAAMMAAIFSSFFATQDNPVPAIASCMFWTIASLPVAALYMFAILPAIDGFPLLVTVLAPLFLLIGYVQADPRGNVRAIPVILAVVGALSLQEVFSADFPSFLNTNLAQIAGIGAALFSSLLFRSIDAGWSARRILRRGWRDIAELAASRRETNRGVWTSAMLDRLGLLIPRLPAAESDSELDNADAMVDLRVGLNVIDLQSASQSVGVDRVATDAVLGAIAHFYAQRASGKFPSADFLSTVDAAVSEVDHAPSAAARRQGLVALAGLRRALFPDAPPLSPLASS